MEETQKQSQTDRTPQQLHAQIAELFSTWEPVLREAGIPAEKYQVPALSTHHTLRRLKSVLAEFMGFVGSENCQLFLSARALHPVGVLARWAGDKNMRTARDVSIYVAARSLFRQAWFTNSALKSFFKVKVTPLTQET